MLLHDMWWNTPKVHLCYGIAKESMPGVFYLSLSLWLTPLLNFGMAYISNKTSPWSSINLPGTLPLKNHNLLQPPPTQPWQRLPGTPPHKTSTNSQALARKLVDKSDNWSLISADRNNKATLLLTILRCTSKSYTKDLSPRMSTLLFAGKHTKPFR